VHKSGTCDTYTARKPLRDRYSEIEGGVSRKLAPLAPSIQPKGGSLNIKQEHAIVAAMNMQNHAETQAQMFREDGTVLSIATKVYVVDGYKNWPSVLAKALVADPTLANGTRQDMADLIQRQLLQPEPFPAYRLSKALTDKARTVVQPILASAQYDASSLTNGLSIRDAVRRGTSKPTRATTTIETVFHPDGVTFGEKGKTYPYESLPSYDDRPWYRLGINFGGRLVPLSVVLAMRGVGIQQFIERDEQAICGATEAERKVRARLINGGAAR
jgi:hypothetical protein